MALTSTQQTTSFYTKVVSQLQVVGSMIYYVWRENDGAYDQIWTAYSNLDGAGFTPTKQTTSNHDKTFPQFQVVADLAYYTWYEYDSAKWQIWMAKANVDGSGFTPAQQTITNYNKQDVTFEVVGNTVYYIWVEADGSGIFQIYTATSDLNGSSKTSTKQTATPTNNQHPQLEVVGGVIYYVWCMYGGVYWQIYTAYSNLNGSGFTSVSAGAIGTHPQLQVVGNMIYYTMEYTDGTYLQIWSATSDLDGLNFTDVQRTTSSYDKEFPQLHVMEGVVHYVWKETDGTYLQIWTATSDLDGSNFTPTKQTTTLQHKNYPQLQVVSNTIYYIYSGYDGTYYQIWTATFALSSGSVYPSDAIIRVTSLIHRYDRAKQSYTLELTMGGVTSDFGLPEWASVQTSAIEPKPLEKKAAVTKVEVPSTDYKVELSKTMNLWETLTPWDEDKGETFTKEVSERWQYVTALKDRGDSFNQRIKDITAKAISRVWGWW